MKSKRIGMLVVSTLLASTVGVDVARASSITFSDGFEAATFDPFWTVIQQNGAVAPTTTQAHSGAQSAAFTSNSGSVNNGQRELHLEHTFGSLLTGDVSVYFFDAAPGQQTLYEQLQLGNSSTSASFSVGTMDFDAFCYEASIVNSTSNLGPNANCGVFPMFSTTGVLRSPGWHLLDIDVQPGSATISIDNTQVFQALGSYAFDSVRLSMSGPAFRPNTTANWDDFNLRATAPNAVPEPATLLLLGSGLVAVGLTRRRRRD